MIILKFGGSSVGSSKMIKCVYDTVVNKILNKNEDISGVVLSALQGTTNQIIDIAKKAEINNKSFEEDLMSLENRHINTVTDLIDPTYRARVIAEVKVTINSLGNYAQGIALIGELSTMTLDKMVSHGELLSGFIISEFFKQEFLKNDQLKSREIEFIDTRKIIVTDNRYGEARVKFEKTNLNIRNLFKNNNSLKIITGFISSSEDAKTTTLGRGGSDYTAAIFAAALNSDGFKMERLEIWTDVDGVMTSDPRKVKKALPVKNMSYEEAMELCHFGAKVIYPPTIIPTMKLKIPVIIKNTFKPELEGTTIGVNISTDINPKSEVRKNVTGVTSIGKISLLRIQGEGIYGIADFTSRIFKALSDHEINILLVTQASSENSICIAVDAKKTYLSKNAIESEFALEIETDLFDKVSVEENLCIVSVVGEGMRSMPGNSAKMFTALGKNGINLVAIAQGSSELTISAVINSFQESKAVNAVHEAFFLSNTRTLNVYLVGTGLIGRTLLKQIHSNYKSLLKNHFIDFQLIGICNSKKMLINEAGIDPTNPLQILADSAEQADINSFINQIKVLNLPNSIFVDCTANEGISELYKSILNSHISIVTPNKKAQSSAYEKYKDLMFYAKKPGSRFLYETSVGAGLPIINSLNDLLKSGDKILKIEAVLSGTLSYLFNNYDGKTPFSELLFKAKELGFTEPDPREDLEGTDVARKILILARECGSELNLSDVEIDNLVPEPLRSLKTVGEFFAGLNKFDSAFQKVYTDAKNEQCRLIYIATYEREGISVKLTKVNSLHPFYTLSGNDNIISFTTERYFDKPLVVKGPGAGAEVTAAGVFADLIRISNYS